MERYDRIKKVGEGSFGKVFKARRKCDGAIVAYKVTEKVSVFGAVGVGFLWDGGSREGFLYF